VYRFLCNCSDDTVNEYREGRRLLQLVIRSRRIFALQIFTIAIRQLARQVA